MDTPEFLTNTRGEHVAYRRLQGRSPGIVFLGGFHSCMQGTKANVLEQWCKERGQGFVRFDYAGHGESQGNFTEGCISSWLADTLLVIDEATDGPQLLVGSSMGAWIMLLAALNRPQKVCALLGIASAADFTEVLYQERLSESQREDLMRHGAVSMPSAYEEEPVICTRLLVEDGRENLLLEDDIELTVPCRFVHSIDDPDIPWHTSLQIMERIQSQDARLILLKDAGHRLSRPQDLALVVSTLDELLTRSSLNTVKHGE